MNAIVRGAVLLLLLVSVSMSTFAVVTVAECVDGEGDSSFRDRCPPGSTKTGDKKLIGVTSNKPKTAAEVAATTPVFLYTVPNCDACDLVRNALNNRGIPVTEKNVEDNSANQDELKSKTGSMTVPAVIVGGTVLNGYNRSALDNALDQAGFPAPIPPGGVAAKP